MDIAIMFRDALQCAYGPLDWVPEADGEIHRFHVPGDKSGSQNGWYVVYADGIASGAFGSWKGGGTSTWCSREPADAKESAEVQERIRQARRQREAERERQHTKAAATAQRWWRDARRADPAHPYLAAKGVRPYSLRQRGDDLLVPLYADGTLVNLQRIAADGSKRFLYGGRIKGVYSPMGHITPGAEICVCEGFATGATLHQEGGYVVACAMNAGNLTAAAVALKARYPDSPIIVAGDDDRQTADKQGSNPGYLAAVSAAQAVSGLVMFPEWPEDAPTNLTDFNDLRCWLAAQEIAHG